MGGNGWIPAQGDGTRLNNSASQSIIGNVRNPSTLDYYSRSDANGAGFTRKFANAGSYCAANTNLPQNNPFGACIIDQRLAVNQIQPLHETANFFGRFTKALGADHEFFTEFGYYRTKSHVDGLATVPSSAYFTPDGVSNSQTAATVLGASHPDNPYFGTAARLSYLPLYDTGISGTDSSASTTRLVSGFKGTMGGWDYDTAVNYSSATQTDTSLKVMDWRVKNALLNPTAANVATATAWSSKYAALPAGTYWRIGENASLNSAAMYDALLANKSRKGESKTYGADFKISKEIAKAPGGPIAIAFGAEVRHEENNLPFYDGLGNYIGLSLTSYGGKRDIYAGFTEVVVPLTKQIELSGALRYDHYSDAGNATTPKVGIKWKPVQSLALRGTYSEGFRAPSSPENNLGSIAAFSGATVTDNARCASLAGLPQATIDANCKNVAPAFVQRGNPDLKPEKSKSYTFGMVWDVSSSLSMNVDFWSIKRSGLPVLEDTQSAVDAGRVVRDTATKLTPGDLGGILNGFVVFQNADRSETRGVDLEVKSRFKLQNLGQLGANLTWTHLQRQRVITEAGDVHDYAGTHGNCEITNCIGSPKTKVSLALSLDMGQWRLGSNINYRGGMSNKLEASDTECAQTTANGADFPKGCRVSSFTSTDLSALFRATKQLEYSVGVSNVFDRKPATDFETYGAIGYYPLDYVGAIGRAFKVSVRYMF